MIMRSCLITGASGGIGKAIATTLADKGFSLILHFHRNGQAIEELISDFPVNSVKSIISADLSVKNGIHQLIAKLPEEIDAVVFAHGNSLVELFQDTTEDAMDEMLVSHVKAPWLISRHFIPGMVRHKCGRIVLISSIWGDRGASCEVVYSSVKGAQNSFVKALGKELAPNGIAVNAVLPGLVATEMNDHLSEEELEALYREIPASRASEPDEVAELVSFLINSKSNYIQGELINVTGGW